MFPPTIVDLDSRDLIVLDNDSSCLNEDDQAYLKSQGIVEMFDGSGWWMKVDNQADGSNVMTPIARAM